MTDLLANNFSSEASTHGKVESNTKGLSFSLLLQGMTPAEHPTPLKSSKEDVRPISSYSNTAYPEAPLYSEA